MIPTWDNREQLKTCLEALEKQTCGSFRVLVCVDGSTDGTLEWLEKTRFSFEHVILTHSNRLHKGRCATRNLSLPVLNAKFTAFLDSDMIPGNNWLQMHKIVLESNNCISLGYVKYADSKNDMISMYLQSRGIGKFKDGRRIPAFHLNTQNTAMKTRYYIQAGGQDEQLDASYGGDDIELGYRLGMSFGVQAIVNKQAVCLCFGRKSIDRLLDCMQDFGAGNLVRIRRKHPDFHSLFRFKWIAASAGISSGLPATPGNLSYILPLLSRLPARIRNALIHALVFISVSRGYASRIGRVTPKGKAARIFGKGIHHG